MSGIYLRVHPEQLSRFVHYKGKTSQPWVKVSFDDFFGGGPFAHLSGEQRFLVMGLAALAARLGNEIPVPVATSTLRALRESRASLERLYSESRASLDKLSTDSRASLERLYSESRRALEKVDSEAASAVARHLSLGREPDLGVLVSAGFLEVCGAVYTESRATLDTDSSFSSSSTRVRNRTGKEESLQDPAPETLSPGPPKEPPADPASGAAANDQKAPPKKAPAKGKPTPTQLAGARLEAACEARGLKFPGYGMAGQLLTDAGGRLDVIEQVCAELEGREDSPDRLRGWLRSRTKALAKKAPAAAPDLVADEPEVDPIAALEASGRG